jgi:hypothetical protein
VEITTRVPVEVPGEQKPPDKDDDLKPLDMPPDALEKDVEPIPPPAPIATDLKPLGEATGANVPVTETPEATTRPLTTKLNEVGEFMPGSKGDEMVKSATAAEAEEKPEIQETVRLTDQIMAELRRREDERLEQRYGKGFIGKGRKWLNATNIGRAVKIGGKVVLGTSATVTAGILTGGAGLVLAPAMFSLGAKEAVDGAIEAGQYLVKGRKSRLKLEGAKQQFFSESRQNLSEWEDKFEKGEITKEQFEQGISIIIEGLKSAEEDITSRENAQIISEKHQQRIRGAISTVVGLGAGLTFGLPLGHQIFRSAGHAVRFGIHGTNFIYGLGEAKAATVVSHLGGAIGHTLGHALPTLGRVGIGAAFAGLAAKTAHELRGARQVGNKELVLPQVSGPEEASQVQEQVAAREETAAEEEAAPPVEEARAEEVPTPPPPPAEVTAPEAPAEAAAVEPVAEAPAPEAPVEAVQPPAAETPEMTGAQFQQVLSEAEKRFNYLPMRIGQIDKKLRELDAEYESIEAKAYKLPEDQARLKEIEAEHAELQAEKEKLMAEKRELKDIDDYINTRNTIDAELAEIEGEWGELDETAYKTEDTRRRQDELQRRYWAERDRREAARQGIIASILAKNRPGTAPAAPPPEANLGAGI